MRMNSMIDQNRSSKKPIKVSYFNPLAAEVLIDPYPYYHWLRANDPVHWGVSGDPTSPGCWYITRYTDTVSILKDQRFGREIWRALPELAPLQVSATEQPLTTISRQWMVLRDPPAHTRLRKLVQRVFTPKMIARMSLRISEIANDLLVPIIDKGCMEIIGDFSLPFAVIVIAEMLGVPSEDRHLFLPWTKALAAVIEFKQTDDVQEQGDQAILELNDYLRNIIDKRRDDPQDDLISALIATDEDQPISEEELLGTCTQLLFGGNDPIAHMIGNGVLALLRHPEQLERWRSNPQLAITAVDEIMRYDSSVQMTFRYALENVSFGGKDMRQDDLIAIVFGSANRDPQQFSTPDHLDLSRSPNRHLSLGLGIHFCMGAALARIEGEMGFNLLLSHLPRLALQEDSLEWNNTVAVRGLKQLQVTF